jgi:hypothetical protein
MLNRQQMELGLPKPPPGQARRHKQGRITRARWWFSRMHQIVEQARDWQPAPMDAPRRELVADKG